MDKMEEIKLLKRNLRDEIYQEIMRLVNKFKEYVSVDHPENPKHTIIEGICVRINYGVVDSETFWPLEIPLNRGERKNYYCYLPNKVEFINQYSKWCSNLIFYNDEIGAWYVYNNDHSRKLWETEYPKELDNHEKIACINELDTDSQIAFLELLETLLKDPLEEFFEEFKTI